MYVHMYVYMYVRMYVYIHFSQAERSTECTACLPGDYCDERGLPLGKICPTGHYCPGGNINPLPCPNVSYTDEVYDKNILIIFTGNILRCQGVV